MEVFALPPYAAYVCQTLWNAGYAAYPVGGCVRDLLLGLTPHDWDVATSAFPEDVIPLFPRVVPTGIQHGTVTVVTDGENVEVTAFRKDGPYSDGRHPDSVTFGTSLEDDLSRRDFTINAMALGPDGTIVDPYGGSADLKAGLIRCVGDPEQRFHEDALRILRGVRFAAKLGFAIEESTWRAMVSCAPLADRVSSERIYAEVEKTLLTRAPHMVGLMVSLGVLDRFAVVPRDADFQSLDSVPCTQEERWRAFCRRTGFPIQSLPVSRALRAAVNHPERALIPQLALSGGVIAAMGYAGAAISSVQKALAIYVLDHPDANTLEALTALLRAWQADGTVPLPDKK